MLFSSPPCCDSVHNWGTQRSPAAIELKRDGAQLVSSLIPMAVLSTTHLGAVERERIDWVYLCGRVGGGTPVGMSRCPRAAPRCHETSVSRWLPCRALSSGGPAPPRRQARLGCDPSSVFCVLDLISASPLAPGDVIVSSAGLCASVWERAPSRPALTTETAPWGCWSCAPR